MHDTNIDGVLEFKNSLTLTEIINRPLSNCTVVGTGEDAIELFNSLYMIDLVRMAKQRDVPRRFFTWLQSFIDIPATDEPITITREHVLKLLVPEETESRNIILVHELALIVLSVKGVIRAIVY